MSFIIGVDDFGKVIQEGFDFIDKSLFIKEILDNAGTEVTVITRPRRFGKTLNMSMLHHFLAAEVGNRHTKEMFDDLNIAECGSTYMEHQGKYPVIFVSFKGVHGPGFDAACEQLWLLIYEIYREHGYLMTSPRLSTGEKKTYEAILNKEISSLPMLENALKELSRFLYLHYGVRPWLLIDEYDAPIQSAYSNKHYGDMIVLMRGILGSALKGNAYLHRAVVTGILRISKESLFSGLNNVDVFSILNTEYATCFGFTQTEIDKELKKAGLGHLTQEIKTWYNGYHIGKHQIYNPWSIASCLKKEGVVGPYWVNTAGYDLIKSSMASASAMAKEKFEQILSGESIEAVINEHMVFGDLKTNSNAVWGLLLFSGYLTATKSDWVAGQLHCCLKAPNQEVGFLYSNIICNWFSDVLGEDEYYAFLSSLVTGKLDEFLKTLKQFLMESMSYFDTKGYHPERFYHGFVLGLIVRLSKTHMVRSNKESGYGRYDVMLIPKDAQQLGLILEFKVADENVPLREAVEQALAQINTQGYETELRQSGIQKILKIGLAFRDKDVEIISEY